MKNKGGSVVQDCHVNDFRPVSRETSADAV